MIINNSRSQKVHLLTAAFAIHSLFSFYTHIEKNQDFSIKCYNCGLDFYLENPPEAETIHCQKVNFLKKHGGKAEAAAAAPAA